MELCMLCQCSSFLYPTGCNNSKHKACMSCIKGNTLSRSPPSYNLNVVLRTAVECPFCKGKSQPYYLARLEQEPDNIMEHNISNHITHLCSKYVHIWIYQGRNNGWWIFNEEMQKNLEKYYQKKCMFKWVICGQPMEYNFTNMTQLNINNGSVRFIKRILKEDMEQYIIKGIAGVK